MVFLLTDQFTVDSRSQHWFTNVVLNMAGDWVFRCRLLDLGMHSTNTEVLLFRVGPTPNSQILQSTFELALSLPTSSFIRGVESLYYSGRRLHDHLQRPRRIQSSSRRFAFGDDYTSPLCFTLWVRATVRDYISAEHRLHLQPGGCLPYATLATCLFFSTVVRSLLILSFVLTCRSPRRRSIAYYFQG